MVARSSIVVRKAHFHAYHGVLPQEQQVGNDYEVSINIDYDFTEAMQTDSLDHTISYADIYQLMAEEMAKPSQLVEHVAGRIGRRLLDTYYNIVRITLTIIKLNPPMGADCEGAGVRVTWVNDKKL